MYFCKMYFTLKHHILAILTFLLLLTCDTLTVSTADQHYVYIVYKFMVLLHYMLEVDKLSISTTLCLCFRDVVWCVPMGSGLLVSVPFARSSAVAVHIAPAQSGSIYAHRNPCHGCCGTSLWGRPHQ